ncbi:MAG: LPS export ABC transporter permease LptF, partial [Acidobacteriota bacterium]
MRLLDRYLIREIIPPLGLSFLVYTFILLLDKLFDSAEMIIRRGLPVSTVGELLVLALPNMLVLTIPMALLLGVLLAVGRLSADSEIVALRATGVSLGRLYRPVLLLSVALFLMNTVLMLWVLPWGNHRLQLRTLEILTQSAASQVQPRIFLDDWENYIVYVFDVPDEGGPWRGVFVAESIPSTRENQVIMAQRGTLRLDDQGERVILDLANAQVHDADLSKPDSYQTSNYRTLQHVLEDEFASGQRAEIVASKGVRELDLEEIREWIHDPARSPALRRLARVELHKRFSIPFACVAFGIFALPLGFGNRRGGKAHGFIWAFGVILAYWIMLDTGEKSAEAGNIPPWLAMWAPNILGVVLGLFLLIRRNRDKSLMISRVDRWIRRDLWSHLLFWRRRRKRRVEARRSEREARRRGRREPQVVLRLPRLRVGFFSIIDRYLVRVFSGIFTLVLLSCLSIFVVADLTGMADEIMKNDVPGDVVGSYYLYSLPQMAYDLSPIIVLVATLITFSVLSRSNEVMAFKALGVSLFRLALPVTLTALAVTAGVVLLEWKILPASNEQATRLEDRIRGRETVRNYRRADRQWLFGPDRYIYNYLHYDAANQSLQRLQVFELDPATYQ